MVGLKKAMTWLGQGLLGGGLAIAWLTFSSTATLAEASFPDSRFNDGSPDRRRAAGPRCPHECINTEQETIFALVPESNQTVTTLSQPDFFFYLPQADADLQLHFELQQRSSGKTIYGLSLGPIVATGGVKHFSLAELPDAPHLQPGESYYWEVTLSCMPSGSSDMYLLLRSEVMRVEADSQLKQILEQADLLGQARLYAENGFWLDSMAALAQAQRSPGNAHQEAEEAWQSLLTSVGLEFFTHKPMLLNRLSQAEMQAGTLADL